MNSRPPISAFERPSRASGAICVSYGVEVYTRLDGTFANLLTRRHQLTAGALGECLHDYSAEHLVGDAELRAGVDAAPVAAQPLAVEQVCPGELRAKPRTTQAVDCLLVQTLSGFAIAHQCTGPSQDSQRRVGDREGRRRDDSLESDPRHARVVAPRCCLKDF
jgi:hypothetical protein